MKSRIASLLSILACAICQAATFNATDNVDALFRYGTEWYDANGNIAAWSYFEIANTPWDPDHQYTAHWAGKVYGFDQSDITYDPTDPIEFDWPATLITVPDIDPTWTVVQINAIWAYDYPDYVVNGGWPTYLYDYTGGDIWVDAQGGVILEAFGSQPAWWPTPLAPAKINKGKHLGQTK